MAAEAAYRDPALTLARLADLGTTPHRLSHVLDAHLRQSFAE